MTESRSNLIPSCRRPAGRRGNLTGPCVSRDLHTSALIKDSYITRSLRAPLTGTGPRIDAHRRSGSRVKVEGSLKLQRWRYFQGSAVFYPPKNRRGFDVLVHKTQASTLIHKVQIHPLMWNKNSCFRRTKPSCLSPHCWKSILKICWKKKSHSIACR